MPEQQFRRAPAHWIYLADMIDQAGYPGRWFVPRRIADYSPNPGDLVCASRGSSQPVGSDGYTSAWSLRGANTHCDLVVAKNGQTLDVIGGNVRNSVSKTTLELDGEGHLQPVPQTALVSDPGESSLTGELARHLGPTGQSPPARERVRPRRG